MAARSNFLIPRGAKSSGQESHSKQLVLHGTTAKITQPHPSTSRALVLRKAAYGSGEVALSRKVSGQEKLSLLADEMMTSAVRAPFRMNGLLKIAESQLGVHLDEISNLKDNELFCDDILITINSRIESAPDKNNVRRPPIHDTRWVASVVGCRIHNVYLLAGAWRIVRNILRELEAMGLDDTDARNQLRTNPNIRTRYLALYDMITLLGRMGQQRLANIAAATTHYAPYFVRRNTVGHGGEMEFDHHGNNPRKIREAHQSFIDAIFLELVLPDSKYPPYVLTALLHNAVEECRKEEKRFSQALWDVVGDFSVIVDVLDILQGPLSGPEGESWIKDTSVSGEFTEFLRVQALSDKASQDIESWRGSLKSIPDTKKEHVLNQLWFNINKSYQQVSGVTIDDLWSLQNDLQRPPRWSTYFIPGLNAGDSDSDQRALVVHKGTKHGKLGPSGKSRLLIEDAVDDDDEYGFEMPALMSVSDTDETDLASEHSDDEELSEGDSESDYDPADDEFLQDMLREALDTAIEVDLLDQSDDFLASAERMNSNPFTRMLANLKDRYFSANPALRPNEKSRDPFKARPEATPTIQSTSQAPRSAARKQAASPPRNPTPAQAKGPVHATHISGADLSPLEPLGGSSRRFHKTTITEVEDEDDAIQSKKKKKKKKKKKPSKKPQETPASSQPPPVLQFIPASPTSSTPCMTTKESPAKQSSTQSSVKNPMNAVDANFSRTSLLPRDITAQSARAYIQSENLTTEKAKVKTRPAFARSFFNPDKESKNPPKLEESGTEKRGLLDRMKPKIKNVPKGISDSLAQLFGSGGKKKSMKWATFLKTMRGLGFSCDPSTAGSSVRFDPPDPRDPPISIHKPHPDSTLQPNQLLRIVKRLRVSYGWSPDVFGVEEEDDMN